MKKIFAALILIGLLLPLAARAQFTYTVKGGAATITGYSGTPPAALVIPATLNGYPVTALGVNAFFQIGGIITSVTIPNSVTNIGVDAFQSCSKLTSLTIPDSVTTISDDAFVNCSGLTNVTIPNSVTSIGNDVFDACFALTSVTIPGSVTSIGSTEFNNCIGLTNVTIDAGVTNISGGAFEGCTNLTSVTIPNSVISIGYEAFAYCSSLMKMTIPSSVTSIDVQAFWACPDLASIEVNGSNPNYASTGGVLYDKARATLILCPQGLSGSYTMPNSVTNIRDYAFYDCSGLTSVTIPNSVTSIGSYAFSGCYGLASVTIPNSVTSIGSYAFYSCSGLASAYFQGNAPLVNGAAGSSDTTVFSYDGKGRVYYLPNTTGWSTTFGGWYTTESPGFTYTVSSGALTITGYYGTPPNVLVIPATINGYPVTAIGANAFNYQPTITIVTIPNGVTSIGSYAFSGCYGLTIVTIPNGVTSIGQFAFDDCPDLAIVTIPGSVTSIGQYAFSTCSSLTSVTIPSSVTSIGSDAFDGCSGLTSIAVNAGNLNYASAGGVLFDKALATLIEYPGGLTGSYTIPNSVTSIGSGAFDACSGLTSVTIPNSVTSLGDYAFSACSGLTNVTIPNSVTSIGSGAFDACSGLTSVTIPSSVTSIGQFAFISCSGLTSAYFQGNAPLVNGAAGSGDTTVFSGDPTGTAYYLPSTTGWGSTFGGWPTVALQLYTYTTNSGAITITGYIGGGGAVNIPTTLNGYPVTAIGNSAFYNQTAITSITIPNSVTSIGSGAFDACSGLTSVTIPSSVTSIGQYVFIYCYGLTSIAVNAGNPNYASAGGVLFDKALATLIQYPGGLTGSYTIPGSVTSIGVDAFFTCSNLTGVTIGSGVTNIGQSAFIDCSGLTSIAVNAGNLNYASAGGVLFDKALATLIQYPGGLTGSYTIPNSVTSIGSDAFDGCSGLTNVTIPNSVTSIGSGAFDACSGLTSVTIPSSVTSIGQFAFIHCSGLTSVTIPGSVTSIGQYAFYLCSGLTSVYFQGNAPLVNGAAGSSDTTVFSSDPTGTAYYLPNTIGWGSTFGGWNTSESPGFTYTVSNGAITITGYYGTPPSALVIPASIAGLPVTAIGANVFYNQTTITSVTIPSSVTSIGLEVFAFCSGLTSVTIPSSVTSIGSGAFYGCSGLKSAYFQGNAPLVNGVAGSSDTTVFQGESGTVFYLANTTGWGATFGGWPTVGPYQPQPQILGGSQGPGVKNNRFGFTTFWATNASVVVLASTNLLNWTPISTNALVSGTNVYTDATWTNYPRRFYRVQAQ